MLTRDGEEATEVGCCGDGGTDEDCFIGVWDTADGSAIIQVLGMHYVVHRRQLDIGGEESMTGTGKVGADDKYPGERRGK